MNSAAPELNNGGHVARKLYGPEYRGPFAFTCSYCFLNQPHTTAEHFEELPAAERKAVGK